MKTCIEDLNDFVKKKTPLPSPLFFYGIYHEIKKLEESLKTWKELYDDQLDWNTKLEAQNERLRALLDPTEKE